MHPKFTIDEQYLTSVSVQKRYNFLKNKEDKTEEDTVKVLRGEGEMLTLSHEDHPEFARLRNDLSDRGLIHIERGWWNGDTVLKPFYLNDFKFKQGGRFCCAGAMGIAMRVARQYNRNTID